MLLGTFRNPPQWQAEAGFHDGSSHKVGPLLVVAKVG